MTRILDITYSFTLNFTGTQEFFDLNIGPALPEVALYGNYQLNGGEIVASGANGTTTFLTIEDAANYLFNIHKNDVVSDVNVGANNGSLYSLGSLISCQQRIKDQILASTVNKVDNTATVNGHALSGNVTVTKSDVSLGNVPNVDATARANHTGTQSAGTITGLATVATSGSYNDLSNKPSIPTIQAYEGTTQRLNAFPIFKSGTVGSGIIAFHLTNDGLSTGTALFPNGVIQDSVNVTVSDATASYQMSWAFTNSNKTLTVTANKLTTANILTGILGQAQANGSVVKLSVWGY